MTPRTFLPIFFSALLPLAAQNVFDLQFAGEGAKDASAAGREVGLHNVVVMNSGGASYGDLDGKGAVVVTADPELSFGAKEPLWIELWINPVRFGKTGAILSKGGGANYRISAQANGQFGFSYYAKGEWRSLQSETPLVMNDWQHVACFFDSPSGRITLFLNGKVVAHAAEHPAFQSKDETPLYIGGSPLGESGNYAGLVGGVGPVIIARGNPREVPDEPAIGQQVFEVKSPF